MVTAAVIGSGPNGLVGAVTLARAGLDVTVYESDSVPGGGCRTEELTLPGFHHDVGSAVHPMAMTSEFFRAFGLTERVPYVTPDISFAHGIAPDRIAVAYRDIRRTAAGLGRDGRAWTRAFEGLSRRLPELAGLLGAPLAEGPRHPVLAARLAGSVLANFPAGLPRLGGENARALFAGAAAHGIGNTRSLALTAVGVVLAAHAHGPRGWPLPIGGAGAVTAALVEDLRAHGGRITTGVRIASIHDVGDAAVVLCDTSARDLAAIGADVLPTKYLRSLRRFRYGNGSAKVDFALSGPVPWSAQELRESPTVHLGGTAAQVAASERAVARGNLVEQPYILVVQPSLVDSTRAPAGSAALWAYVHVPAGSDLDATEYISAEIERYAPGFRDLILGSAATSACQLEARNPNFIGGDIGSGATNFAQLLARPRLAREPWRTPTPGLYLGSAAVPPGPGVHGSGGFYAARAALSDLGIAIPSLAPSPEVGRPD
ncbi:phytoene desaturase family protein [Mycetocola spongiae]|uniref:phytoene desaturase family protein n=1 Tax=Mycetocola spongiae TaxID=2859226 RepID=UPI001CF264A3|nr:NAD(P)/FAD-dependent oxidoreductase [Mycetocola spongiae]UCR87874.1 NAD(P)/FAD-dependent oxidoreductase [Mycetocola spongiae]